MRPSMTDILMDFAEAIAKRSTCEERQVGAVVASGDFQKIYSVGYNGGAKGMANTCMCKLGNKYGCVHAEQNALVKCTATDKDKVMFVTLAPCTMCATLMINEGGYKTVYYRQDWKDNPGIQLLQQAGITCIKL